MQHIFSGESGRRQAYLNPFLVIVFVLALALAAGLFARTVYAGQVATQPAIPVRTPTPGASAAGAPAGAQQAATGSTAVAPAAVGTGAAPAAVPTTEGQGAPGPDATAKAGVAASQTLVASGGSTSNDSATGSGNAASASTSGFPWLWLLLVVLVLLIALAAVFTYVRSRRPALATARIVNASAASSPVAYSGRPAGPAPIAQTEAAATSIPGPTTVVCPNCGTTNNISENFCHECGQDLRPARAALLAAAAPGETALDNTPYLETLDRSDEQLEYVLARDRVTIGTASTNDIVVDSAFAGWDTVAPVHAELVREQEGFAIRDKNSDNGTFVNDVRTGENILADGDVIRIGEVRFVFHVPQETD